MTVLPSALAALLLVTFSVGPHVGPEPLPAVSLLRAVPDMLTVRLAPPRLAAAQSQAQAEDPDDGFEAISELPPDEQLPAAPMVVAAYIFVLLAFFMYVFSLSRRLAAVKQDMSRLESEVKRNSRT